MNSTKAFDIFSCRFLVVHISPSRTGQLNSHHQQSPMRVEDIHTTGCCPVPRRDLLRHCYHHLIAVVFLHGASHLGFGGPEPCLLSRTFLSARKTPMVGFGVGEGGHQAE
jgi:hypothetical protein